MGESLRDSLRVSERRGHVRLGLQRGTMKMHMPPAAVDSLPNARLFGANGRRLVVIAEALHKPNVGDDRRIIS